MNRSRRNSMQRSFVSGGVYDPRQQFQQQPQQQYLQREVPPPPQLNVNEEPKYINPEPPVFIEPPPAPIIDKINQIANITETTAGDGDDGDVQERKGYFKKIFGIRKKPSIRAKEKKIRQNRRLRKVLLPKNALMALHEVKNIKIEDFIINSNLSGGFTATVSVNNVQYEGAGNSKNAAKNNACEKALRDLVIMKMNQKPIKSQKSPSDQMDDNESIIGSTGGGTSVAGDEDMQMKDSDDTDEDELPMLNLASFALFKLFSEWEAAGFEVPEFRPTPHSNGNNSDGGGSIIEKPKKTPNIRTELPSNWETMHPATLLCMMRPGITYVDDGCEGQPPNLIQKMGVTIESEHYVGSGRSKKIARKNAAVIACNKLNKITNQQQFECLVTFMENHEEFAKGKILSKQESKNLWKELSENLNGLGLPVRDVDGWVRVWKDFRFNIKKKMTHNKKEQNATGGGRYRKYSFSDLENRVVELMAIEKTVAPQGSFFGFAAAVTTEIPAATPCTRTSSNSKELPCVPSATYTPVVMEEDSERDESNNEESNRQPPLPSKARTINSKKKNLENERRVLLESQTTSIKNIEKYSKESSYYLKKIAKLKEEKLKIYKDYINQKKKDKKDELQYKKENLEYKIKKLELMKQQK